MNSESESDNGPSVITKEISAPTVDENSSTNTTTHTRTNTDTSSQSPLPISNNESLSGDANINKDTNTNTNVNVNVNANINTNTSIDLSGSFTSESGSISNLLNYEYTPTKHQHNKGYNHNGTNKNMNDVDYNEEDLRKLAESLAPRVTSLLNSNEAALENLLSSTRNFVHEYDANNDDDLDPYTRQRNHDDNEGDEIEGELDRLADAERLLRDELEMSNVGFDFMRYTYGSEDDDNDDDASDEDADADAGADMIATKIEIKGEGEGPSDVGNIIQDLDMEKVAASQHFMDDHDNIYDSSSAGSGTPSVSLFEHALENPDSNQNTDIGIGSPPTLLLQTQSSQENVNADMNTNSNEIVTANGNGNTMYECHYGVNNKHDHGDMDGSHPNLQISSAPIPSMPMSLPLPSPIAKLMTKQATQTMNVPLRAPELGLDSIHSCSSSVTNASAAASDIDSKIETYTLYDHAKRIGLLFDNADLGYPTCPLLTEKDAEAILDVPVFRTDFNNIDDYDNGGAGDYDGYRDDLNYLSDGERTGFGGLDDMGVANNDNAHAHNTPQKMDKKMRRAQRMRKRSIRDIMRCTREYVKPMTSAALNRIFMGISDGEQMYHKNTKLMKRKGGGREREIKQRDSPRNDTGTEVMEADEEEEASILITNANGQKVGNPNSEIFPVKTVAIQIRPDVLVGAVMDAVYSSINSLNGEVTKRQGGHLRALIPARWVPESECLPFRNLAKADNISKLFGSPVMQTTKGVMNGMVFQPAIVVDVQLCTRKRSRFAERILLVRCYSISDGQVLDNGAAICPTSPGPPHAPLDRSRRSSSPDFSEAVNEVPNNIIREASSLFQRMRTVATVGGKIAFDLGDIVDENDDANHQSLQTPSNAQESSFAKMLKSPLKMFSPSTQKKKVKPGSPRKKQEALNIRFDSPEKAFISQKSAAKLVSQKLISVFTETPSVMDAVYDIDPIAALSPVDWPSLQSSSRFLTDCLNELDNRDLGFNTLASCAFGAFPSLMTLDVHYCSQMKDICKENMISALLKSAQELEIYAREAEYECAKLMQILQPILSLYNEELPAIPVATPLTSYPLDFTPPEVACPPWGQKVVEALNLVAAKSPSSSGLGNNPSRNSSKNESGLVDGMSRMTIKGPPSAILNSSTTEFSKAKDAVYTVLTAFQKQEDDELSARIGRKNCQVMDRLAKMQAYKREALMSIRGSYGINIPATKAANKFHAYAKECCKLEEIESKEDETENSSRKMAVLPASDQVPILECRVVFGGSTGTCYLTYHEILLVTQNIPLVGGNYLNIAMLNDVELEVKSKAKRSRLNPLPSILIVKRKHDGKELFSFRPSTGAHLFKDFVNIIQEIAHESPDAVNFSSAGGLQNIYDQKKSFARAALGDLEI